MYLCFKVLVYFTIAEYKYKISDLSLILYVWLLSEMVQLSIRYINHSPYEIIHWGGNNHFQLKNDSI